MEIKQSENYLQPVFLVQIEKLMCQLKELDEVIGKLIRQAPEFEGDVKLAGEIGKKIGTVMNTVNNIRGMK